MQYRILGPLVVLSDARELGLGALKDRTVLGVLLLHANEVVSRQRLIDELWGESPPPTAVKAVNGYVSQLRKALGGSGSGPIATRPPGYLIEVRRRRARRGGVRRAHGRGPRAGKRRRGRGCVGAVRGGAGALARPPAGGLELESVGRHELERLEEQRVVALMDRIDCDLASDGTSTSSASSTCSSRSTRSASGSAAQQMVALYRSGRQADALRAYQRARAVLVDELGLEPSPALQRLERGILNHDPSLQSSAGTAHRNAPSPFGPPSCPRRLRPPGLVLPGARRRLLAAALAGAVALAAGGLAATLIRGGTPQSALAAAGNPILLVDPGSARAADQIALPRRPLVAAGDSRTLWVGGADGMLTRISGAASSTVETPNVGGSIGGLAIGNGSVWATDQERRKVVRFDPSTWKVVDRIPVGNGAQAIAFGGGSAWVANRTDATISRVDPSSDKVTATIPIGISPAALAFGAGRSGSPTTNSAWSGGSIRGRNCRLRRQSTSARCRYRWRTGTAQPAVSSADRSARPRRVGRRQSHAAPPLHLLLRRGCALQ